MDYIKKVKITEKHEQVKNKAFFLSDLDPERIQLQEKYWSLINEMLYMENLMCHEKQMSTLAGYL